MNGWFLPSFLMLFKKKSIFYMEAIVPRKNMAALEFASLKREYFI